MTLAALRQYIMTAVAADCALFWVRPAHVTLDPLANSLARLPRASTPGASVDARIVEGWAASQGMDGLC